MDKVAQKFGLIISSLTKNDTLYIGDLAWTMGREKSISDIGKISKTDKLKLINEYISNKHYLIESQLKNTSEYSNSLKENQKFDYVFIDIFHRQHSYFHDLKHFSGFEIEHLSTISKKGFALIVANVDEFSSDKVKKIMHEQGD